MSNLSDVVDYFRSKGLTSAQAAGVAGNFVVESGVDPTRVNPNENAHGIGQWEGGRWGALQQFAAMQHRNVNDLATQEDFAWWELNGPEKGALSALEQTTTAGDAAAVFDQDYERSSGAARQKRIDAANQIQKSGAGGFSWSDLTPTHLGTTLGNAVTGAADGVLGSTMSGVKDIALTVLGLGAAVALFVVGARQTFSEGA